MSGREPEHLSIGEVLAELSDEFPDITISKIRFLESQGLVNPERTPSGYRKFYAHDLVRLRWILFQQKEHFLPLKVIKERLDELPPGTASRLFESTEPANADAGTADDAAPAPPALPLDVPAASASPEPATPARRRGRRTPAFAPTLPADTDADAPLSRVSDGRHTRAELAAAAGVEPGQVEQLESYGLLVPVRELDGVAEYDD